MAMPARQVGKVFTDSERREALMQRGISGKYFDALDKRIGEIDLAGEQLTSRASSMDIQVDDMKKLKPVIALQDAVDAESKKVGIQNPAEILEKLRAHEEFNRYLHLKRTHVQRHLTGRVDDKVLSSCVDQAMLLWGLGLFDGKQELFDELGEESLHVGQASAEITATRMRAEHAGSSELANRLMLYDHTLNMSVYGRVTQKLKEQDEVVVFDCGAGAGAAMGGLVQELIKGGGRVEKEGDRDVVMFPDGKKVAVFGSSLVDYGAPEGVNIVIGDTFHQDLSEDVGDIDLWLEMYGPTTHGTRKKQMMEKAYSSLRRPREGFSAGEAHIFIHGLEFRNRQNKLVKGSEFFDSLSEQGIKLDAYGDIDRRGDPVEWSVLRMARLTERMHLPMRLKDFYPKQIRGQPPIGAERLREEIEHGYASINEQAPKPYLVWGSQYEIVD